MTSKSLAATFARELRAVRQAFGWTQAEVAERVGIAVEAYGRLERGGVLPRADTLVRLAAALRVSTDHLLGISPEAAPSRRRVAAEPEAEYAAPPEMRRLLRRLRGESLRTIRLLDALVSSLQTGRRERTGGR